MTPLDREETPLTQLRRGRPSVPCRVERQAAAAASRDERLLLVLSESRTGVWEWDVASGSLKWSDQILLVHGYAAGAAAPSFDTYVASIHPDDRAMFVERIEAAVANLEPYTLEYRVVWPDGSVHWTLTAGRPFSDEQHGVRMLGTGQDISERRRLEEVERRASELREALVDVLSHELRTPIATILGSAEILTNPMGQLDPEVRDELLKDIVDDAERLEHIVEDLVVMSRAEHGTLEANRDPVMLQRIVERVVASEQCRWPGVSFTAEVPDNLPLASADEVALEQVLRNLLGNAAKYSPIGSSIRVRLELDQGEILTRVLDDGPGFPPADAERLFELFFRADSDAARVKGSGIGLFVCARLIESMGGRVWALVRTEGGAEFGFALQPFADEGPSDLDAG